MKIATYPWGGRRCVGLVSQDHTELTPLALPEAERADGVLALIRHLAAGVGMGMNSPAYLRSGDFIRIEIDGVGFLEHPFK